MSDCEVTNDYLLELLALQQDGRQAISAPSNWTTQIPLLDVQTDVDEIVDDLSDAILERMAKTELLDGISLLAPPVMVNRQQWENCANGYWMEMFVEFSTSAG